LTQEFKANLVFCPKSGHIISKRLRWKIAQVNICNGLYEIPVGVMSESVETMTGDESIVEVSERLYSPKSVLPQTKVVVNKMGDESEESLRSVKSVCNKRRRMKRKLSDELWKAEGDLWHRRMGHVSAQIVQRIPRVTDGVNDELCCMRTLENCEICAKAKLTQKSFSKDRDRATRPCEVTHADLIGPISPSTLYTRFKHVLTVIDDHTRFLQVFMLQSKAAKGVAECMREAYRVLRSEYPGAGQFKDLRCDQGLEFDSAEVKEVLDEYGVGYAFSEAYCHQHNDLIERVNRTIEERTRALLFESGFPTGFWGQAVQAACFIYNRTPHSAIAYRTPYEMFYKKLPDLAQMKVFGSRASVLDEQIKRGCKFDSRAKVMYISGYTRTGYILYDPETKKTVTACSVKVDKTKLYRDAKEFDPHACESLVFGEMCQNDSAESGGSGSRFGTVGAAESVETNADDEFELVSVEEVEVYSDDELATPVKAHLS
jgi:hypothetical protein